MDRPASELFLAALFLDPTPERQAALAPLVAAAQNWDGLLESLEAHRVLGLFHRNLSAAGVELPAGLDSAMTPGLGRLRDADQRVRLALERALGFARGAALDVTVLGEVVDALELYPEPGLRVPGPIQLHVPARDFAGALRALRQAGFLVEEASLPSWWYRSLGLPIALAPISPFLCALRLRSRLHHPSLLVSAAEGTLLGRRVRLEPPRDGLAGMRAMVLDPLDRLLDGALELASGGGEALTGGRRALLEAATRPDHPLRLDRVLDLHARVEREHARLPVEAVLERAREWSAETALRAALECVQTGLGLQPGARDWARQIALTLARSHAGGSRSAAAFRPDPIERLPLWLRPGREFLARRHGSVAKGRQRHTLELARQGLLAAAGWPLALVARRADRDRRRSNWAEAQRPDRLSDLTAAWRAAQRVEEQAPIRPQTLSLPERDPQEARLPDHYRG